MAEKRVSVRLGATGGDQVKSELRGVGAAGERGMRQISREAEIAQAKLASFARRAKIALAVASAALIATGVAAIRSGLSTIDAQAKLAQSLDTTVASVQVLTRAGDLAGVSMGQIEQAAIALTRRLSQAATGTGPAVAALDRLGLSAAELLALPLDQRISTIQKAITRFIPAAEQAAAASALFGDRAGLIFSRIQPDVLARANDELARFGVLVSDDQARRVEAANDSITRLGLVWTGLANQLTVSAAPAIERVTAALADMAREGAPVGAVLTGLIDSFAFLIENIDAAATTAGVFVALMGGRWVVNMGLATAATLRAAGGVAALGIAIKAIPFVRVALAIAAVGGAMVGLADDSDETAGSVEAVEEAQDALNIALGVFSKTGAPSAGREAIALAQNLKKQAEAALAAAEAQNAVNAARLAAVSGFPDAEQVNPSFADIAADATESAEALADATARVESARVAIKKLALEITGGTGRIVIGGLDDPDDEDKDKKGGGGAARRISAAADALNTDLNPALADFAAKAREADQQFATFAAGVIKGTTSLRDVLSRLGEALLMSGLTSLSRRTGIGGVFSSLFGGGLPSFAGGGFTGSGPRSGGIDGRGGFLSVMHPDEVVHDLTRGGGAAVVNVRVSVDDGGGLRAFVERQSGAVAATVVDNRMMTFARQEMPRMLRNLDPARNG